MFGGFTEGDFSAYAEHKWRSNAFSLERLAVKEKLIALGRELGHTALATDGSELHRETSTEHPALWNQKRVDAQHLFFTRDRDTRLQLDRIIERSRSLASLIQDPSPQRSHAVLAVSIDAHRVRVAFRLHADATVDRQNFASKVAREDLGAELIDALRGFPEEFYVALSDGPRHVARTLAFREIEALLAELGQPLAPGESRWLIIARDFPVSVALDLGAEIAKELRAALELLLPVFHFVAWTPNNDHIDLFPRFVAEEDAKRLAKNDRVRVVAGMFSGRVGRIQELDDRGSLKILVGKIPIVVDAQDVEKL